MEKSNKTEEDIVLVNYYQETHCLEIILNRKPQMNALSLLMIRKLTKILNEALNNRDIYFVLLTSSHEKAFCAGGDIKALSQTQQSDEKSSMEYVTTFFKEEFSLNYLIYTFSKQKPIISLLNGITMGGGVGISIYTTIRVATEKNFVFAMPEVFIGLYPDIGASWFLNRYCKSCEIAKYVALTGDKLDVNDSLFCNFIDYSLNDENFKNLKNYLTKEFICGDNNNILQKLNDSILKFKPKTYRNSLQISKLERYRRVIDYCFIENTIEKIINRLQWYKTNHDERNETDNLFIDKILFIFLKKACPTSLKVTLEALKRGKECELKEVLENDFKLCTKLVCRNDFKEGVRSVVIEKNSKPNFTPGKIVHVDDASVNMLFH
ncbi:hypothetical protein ABK040_001880 [Willaertia magna]